MDDRSVLDVWVDKVFKIFGAPESCRIVDSSRFEAGGGGGGGGKMGGEARR